MTFPDPFLFAPVDRQLHFFVGMTTCLGFAVYGHPSIGLAIAILLAAFKEWVWDRLHPVTHTVDMWDFTATVAGGLLAFCVALLARVIHD